MEALSSKFPTIQSAYTEIINLNAILNLPKGTEHFISDLHGQYDAFAHFLKNGSGGIINKINDVFGDTITLAEQKSLSILVVYPEQIIEKYKKILSTEDFQLFVERKLIQLIDLCKEVAHKYTKSKVRKTLPKYYAYIMEELMYEATEDLKEYYYKSIVDKIIELDRGTNFILAFTKVIQELIIDHLHIVGDIYDRGDNASDIIDKLIEYDKVDIQWGNHDILWMGACAGNELCITNTIRIAARYNQLDVLTESYGINLLPIVRLKEKY